MHARRMLSLLSFALLLFITRPAQAQEQPQTFDADGVKIRYIVKGAGEPVVLIHGFAASYQMNWGAPGIIDALSKDYMVIALDNRGHGGSEKPHEPEKYGEEMVEDVVRLLDHLQIKKAHVVGYSMGAFITNKLITRHPERIISATLGGGGWMRPRDERFGILIQLAESLENGDGIKPLIIALTPAGRPRPSDEQLELTNRLVLFANDPKALAAAARGMLNFAVSEDELKANHVPRQVIIGEIDPLKAGVDEMREVLPDLRVVVIERADHMNAFTSPLFLTSLTEFFAEHSRQPAAVGAD